MTLPLVLLHSPLVGPATWLSVAHYLLARGRDVVVPDLRFVTTGEPPYWPRVADTVIDAMYQLDTQGPVVLVGHSNAGLFLPLIADASPRPVAGAVFVDASLPADHGETPVLSAGLFDRLAALADATGRLPRWSDWWPEKDVASLLPDPDVRAMVVAEQPRLPLTYFEQTLPEPVLWKSIPCGYLQFSRAYDDQADRAGRAGWPVVLLPGGHLHQVVDPYRVADVLLQLVAQVA